MFTSLPFCDNLQQNHAVLSVIVAQRCVHQPESSRTCFVTARRQGWTHTTGTGTILCHCYVFPDFICCKKV